MRKRATGRAAVGRGGGRGPANGPAVRLGGLDAAAVLDLQRTAGNAATTGLVQRKAAAKEESTEDKARAVFDAAEAAYHAGDYPKAAESYVEAYRLVPRPAMLFNAAQSYRRAAQWREARRYYEQYLAAYPDSPYKVEVEGRIQEATKHVHAANAAEADELIGTVEAAEKQAADVLTGYHKTAAKAEKLYAKGKYEAAIPLYTKLYTDTGAPGMAFNVAQCYRMLGRTAEAAAWYRTFIASDPDSKYRKEAEQNIASMEGAGRSEERDVELGEVAAGGDIGAAMKSFTKAESAYNKGRFADALKYYKAAFDETGNANIAFNIAQCHRRMKHWSEAAVWYKAFLRMNPESPYAEEVRQNIADCERHVRHARNEADVAEILASLP